MSDEQARHAWDAVTYDSLSLPHEQWGRDVVNGLRLRGDERVLDVGAGTGRDTETLLQRLPRGHVVAVDGIAAIPAQLRCRPYRSRPCPGCLITNVSSGTCSRRCAPVPGHEPLVAELSSRLNEGRVSYARLHATARRPGS